MTENFGRHDSFQMIIQWYGKSDNSQQRPLIGCKAVAAIDHYFQERNEHFLNYSKKAGEKLWGNETVVSEFAEPNNYKDEKRRWNREIIAGGSMAHLLSITSCFNDICIRDFTDYRKVSMEPLK